MVETLETALRKLGDSRASVRRSAAITLGEIGEASATEILIHVLSDSAVSVRRAAYEALVRIGEPAVEPLCHALSDANMYVRHNVAYALVRIGDARAVDPLIRALNDSSEYVRSPAALALGRIGDVRAVEPLCKALSSEASFQRSAAMTLGELGDARAVTLLLRALDEGQEIVRRAVSEALGQLGSPETLPRKILLQEEMSLQDRVAALHALREKGRYYEEEIIRVKGATKTRGCFHHYRIPEARRLCQQLATEADPRLREIVAEMLRFLDDANRKKLLRPTQRDETVEPKELLRVVSQER